MVRIGKNIYLPAYYRYVSSTGKIKFGALMHSKKYRLARNWF